MQAIFNQSMKYKPRILLSLIACSMLLSAFALTRTTYAEPELTETTEYYEVKGGYQAEIDNNMLTIGPIAGNKRIAYATMAPRFSWRNITVTADADWCVISNISIQVAVIYNMPQWTGYAGASSDLQRKWDDFYERVQRHEKEHTRQALDAARTMEREVLQIRRRSCQEAREGIMEAYKKSVEQFKNAAHAMDAKSGEIFGKLNEAR
jgi:predicted secreted Zn-dependent protease